MIATATIPALNHMLTLSYRDDSPADKAVMNEMFMQNVYRLEGYKLSGNRSVVFDLGANIGTFTLQALKLAYDNNISITVYAVEPEKDNLELLDMNLDNNRWLFTKGSNVVIVTTGVSDFNGESFITSDQGGSRLSDDESLQKIDVVTFDELITMAGVESIDFTKIDIEGSEVPLVAGATRESLLKSHHYAIELDNSNVKKSFLSLVEPFLDDFSVETWGIPNQGCNVYLENHHWEKK